MSPRVTILVIAKLGISALLLYLVLSRVSLGEIVSQLQQANPLLVAGVMVLGLGSAALSAWRWEALAPGILTFPEALRYTWIGLFFAHVLPGAISGDIAKGVSLAITNRETRTGVLPLSILADKLIGLFVLLVFFDAACLLVFVLYDEMFDHLRRIAYIALVASAAGVLATVAGVMLLLKLRARLEAGGASRVRRLLAQVANLILYYVDRPGPVIRAAAISVAIHSLNIVAFYLTLRALHVDANLYFAAIVYPILSIVLLVPISVSGIGVRDVTLMVLFQMFGLSGTAAVASAWLSLVAALPNVLIGGALQLAEIYRKR